MIPNIVGLQYTKCPSHEAHLHLELLVADDVENHSTTGSYVIVGVQAFDTQEIEVDIEASGIATDSLRFQLIAADVQDVMGSMTPASRAAFEKVAQAAGVQFKGDLAGPPLKGNDKATDDDDDDVPGQYL